MIDNEIYDEFKTLLDNDGREKPLQKYLENNPEIISKTFHEGAQNPLVIPLYKLANNYITDFIFVGVRSYGSLDVHLIEIEPAINEKPLFNNSNQSTGRLRVAEGQIMDWRTWMNEYENFFKVQLINTIKKLGRWDNNLLSKITTNAIRHDIIYYHIIIGRRKDFDGEGDKYRHTYQARSGNREEIATWDRLLATSQLMNRVKVANKQSVVESIPNKVFISYKKQSKSENIADNIAHKLSQKGIEVWFDKWEITAGDSIPGKIGEGFTDVDACIIFINREYSTSVWCTKEMNTAITKGINETLKIIPSLVENCCVPELLKDLRRVDFIDIDPTQVEFEAKFKEITDAIFKVDLHPYRIEQKKNKRKNTHESDVLVINDSERIAEALEQMHKRMLYFREQKLKLTIQLKEFKKTCPMLSDRMGLIKFDDYDKYIKGLRKKYRPLLKNNNSKGGFNRLRVKSKIEKELFESKEWTMDDITNISNLLDELDWGIRGLRDKDKEWNNLYDSLKPNLSSSNDLRLLIEKHIKFSHGFCNISLVKGHARKWVNDFDATLLLFATNHIITRLDIDSGLNEIIIEIRELLRNKQQNPPVFTPHKYAIGLSGMTGYPSKPDNAEWLCLEIAVNPINELITTLDLLIDSKTIHANQLPCSIVSAFNAYFNVSEWRWKGEKQVVLISKTGSETQSSVIINIDFDVEHFGSHRI